MSDLPERLRNRYCSMCDLERGAGGASDMKDAADEIDRLTAENKSIIFKHERRIKEAVLQAAERITKLEGELKRWQQHSGDADTSVLKEAK